MDSKKVHKNDFSIISQQVSAHQPSNDEVALKRKILTTNSASYFSKNALVI